MFALEQPPRALKLARQAQTETGTVLEDMIGLLNEKKILGT